MSIFLSVTLNNQALESRRREIGLLRGKGFSSTEISHLIITEAIFIGLFAGMLSVISGYFSSAAILQVIASQNDILIPIQVSVFTFFFSIFMGIFLSYLSMIRTAKRFSKMKLTSILQNYNESEEFNQTGKSKGDIFFIIQGILPVIFIVINPKSTFFGMPYEIQLIWAIIYPIITGMTIVAPFTLTYGLVRFITIYSLPRFSKFVDKLIHPITKDQTSILINSITRNPKRASRVVYIVAMLMCFQIITAIVAESEHQYEREMIYFNVGSDCAVYYNPKNQDYVNGMPLNLSLGQELLKKYPNEISNITDVIRLSNVGIYGQDFSYNNYQNFLRSMFSWTSSQGSLIVYGIEALKYAEITSLKPSYFNGKDPKQVLSTLNNNYNGCLLDIRFAEAYGYKVGDIISLGFEKYPQYIQYPVNFQIVGFYRLLPAMTTNFDPSIVANLDYLNNKVLGNTSYYLYSSLLLKIAVNANTTLLYNSIQKEFSNRIYGISVLESALDNYENRMSYSTNFISIVNLFSIDFYFLLIIASFGVGILFYITIYEKRREICLLRIRGLEKRDLIKLQFIEGIVLLVIGAIISLIGFFLAYVINLELDQITDEILQRSFVVPWTTILGQFAFSFGLFIIIIYLTTLAEIKYSERGPIAEILRMY
jgi:ABC-type lipoprotein release transport system permease subunit